MNNHPSFSLSLLEWYRQNGRELPWRNTRDPYAIWLSEIILQQTRVQQGWDYWERFMRRWPSVELLAAATEDEVLREWQGLGYYSRARNLHFAAKQIVERGSFPATYDTIRQLKGVGDYTAAAIASFAFGEPKAVVDGNVYRVLSRHYGIATPINTTEGKKEFSLLAQELLPVDKPAAYNQAIMDFGATVCTPQSPRCTECPLQESCMALRERRVGDLPVKLKTLKVQERRLAYIYIRWHTADGHCLTAIRRRGAGDIWQGLWEPVERSVLTSPSVPILIAKDFRHVLTHRVLLCDFYLLETTEQLPLPEDYQWVSEQELDNYAFPRMFELLIKRMRALGM